MVVKFRDSDAIAGALLVVRNRRLGLFRIVCDRYFGSRLRSRPLDRGDYSGLRRNLVIATGADEHARQAKQYSTA